MQLPIEKIPKIEKPDNTTYNTIKKLIKHQDMQNKKLVLAEAMQVLNDREVKILTARKLSYSPETLDSLSVKYDISKERVRQIESRAFEKLQNYMLTRISKDGQFKTIAN